MRRASDAVEAATLMGHTDGGKTLTETLEAYTATANGEREDDFGKTVFPAKTFSPKEPLRESKSGRILSGLGSIDGIEGVYDTWYCCSQAGTDFSHLSLVAICWCVCCTLVLVLILSRGRQHSAMQASGEYEYGQG